MARPRTFDEDAVVDAAMACFREHGFVATSIRDLEQVTGLSAPSLYNAFGDKRRLFARALARYDRVVLQRRIDEHLRDDAGLDGIRSFFTSVRTVEPAPEQGCLLTTTAMERAFVDDAARELVDIGLNRLRDAFARILRTVDGRRSATAEREVVAAADALVVLYQGMLVLLRAQTSTIALDGAIEHAIAHLGRRPTHRSKGPNR